ncbi:hypothetical protein N7453_001523 [Penicillium expansum]|nr:hypothetical protein N7453_001523 [Penicillium expansum]
MKDKLATKPEIYDSRFPDFPPGCMYLGPSGSPGSGSFLAMLEFVVEYIIKCTKKLQREYISSMEPTMEAHKDFSKHVDKYFEKTIFNYKCKSWFKKNEGTGRIVGIWPGSSLNAERAMSNPRFEDYQYIRIPEMKEKMFNWLGNGLTMSQEQCEKTTQYLDELDIPPTINHGPRPELPAALACQI